MNKQEAILAMKEGKKVTHRHFVLDERMTMKNGMIVLEDGVTCPPDGVTCPPEEFWKYRTDAKWDDGYELFES